VVGVASSQLSDHDIRERARTALEATGRLLDPEVLNRLLARLTYCPGNYRDPATFEHLVRLGMGCRLPVAYLAIPPGLFATVVEGLASAGLNGGRVVVEKPFGRDLESARELNRILREHYREESIYRIDHFLGKEPVLNLLVFRFANTLLEPVWNRHYIDNVQVSIAESLGVEGRGSFYEGVGALRDVVQNHLLQIVSLLAMEPPISEDADALSDETVKVLKAVRSLDPARVVRGQYEGYTAEPGVAPNSTTETFAAATFEIDSWRWAGVPFHVRTGKQLERTVTEAVVEFKAPPRLLFADSDVVPHANTLHFRIKPHYLIGLSMQAKLPGERLVSREVDLEVMTERELGVEGPEAYERLLGDALEGDRRLFARQDAVEEAWRIIDPVVAQPGPVHLYKPGSRGPVNARDLVGSSGHWHADEEAGS
jgi:glucose-6-phosphate 1-dehydrogenase